VGVLVPAGSIVWPGTGEILLPARWDAGDLGAGCGPLPARSFKLAGHPWAWR